MNRTGVSMLSVGFMALGVTVIVTTASAMEGGPRLVEVLGYDPGERKIFILHHDESEATAVRSSSLCDQW